MKKLESIKIKVEGWNRVKKTIKRMRVEESKRKKIMEGETVKKICSKYYFKFYTYQLKEWGSNLTNQEVEWGWNWNKILITYLK